MPSAVTPHRSQPFFPANPLQDHQNPASNQGAFRQQNGVDRTARLHSPDNSMLSGAKPQAHDSLNPRQPPIQERSATTEAPEFKGPQLHDVVDHATLGQGERALKAAQTAYTHHAQLSVGVQSTKALKLFVATCSDPSYQTTPDLIQALKSIKLPAGIHTNLSVTIQDTTRDNQPTVSLIPPDENNLCMLDHQQILNKYILAARAMEQWTNKNGGEAALERALQEVNQTLAALKQIREHIDKQFNEKTGLPGECMLEVRYQRTVDEGVTICETVEDDILEHGVEGLIPPMPQA